MFDARRWRNDARPVSRSLAPSKRPPLDPNAPNAYKQTRAKGQTRAYFPVADSRSEAHRRGWMNPPARRGGARSKGLRGALFYYPNSALPCADEDRGPGGI